MGSSRFNEDAYRSYVADTGLKSKAREEVFSQRSIHSGLDPKKISIRESRDSDANPNSTPIAIFLDVTGSMGWVAEKIAKDSLPMVFNKLYEEAPVSDPHIAFGAIGDIRTGDRAPLQMSQFEAGAIELITQLRQIYLEGGGGGNSQESYDLAWYILSQRAAIDSYEKRGQKGYAITIGDEPPPVSPITANNLQSLFGTNDLPVPASVTETLEWAEQEWRVFHFIIAEGDYVRSRGINRVFKPWNQLLGPNVVIVDNVEDLPELISATLKIAEGADVEMVIERSSSPIRFRNAFSALLEHSSYGEK